MEYIHSIEFIATSRKGRGCKNLPRKMVMYFAKKIYDYRLKEIGEFFGLTHYRSVANAIFALSTEIAAHPEINLTLKAIIKRLNP